MCVAFGAHDFGADHTVTVIRFFRDPAVSRGFGKAGPAATGVKFGIGLEQGLATADTFIGSGGFGLIIFTGKWRFGGFFTSHRELGWGQFFSPFIFGLFDFFGHTRLHHGGNRKQ